MSRLMRKSRVAVCTYPQNSLTQILIKIGLNMSKKGILSKLMLKKLFKFKRTIWSPDKPSKLSNLLMSRKLEIQNLSMEIFKTLTRNSLKNYLDPHYWRSQFRSRRTSEAALSLTKLKKPPRVLWLGENELLIILRAQPHNQSTYHKSIKNK